MADDDTKDTTTNTDPQEAINAAVAAREAELQASFAQQIAGLEKSKNDLLSEKKAAVESSRALKDAIGERDLSEVSKTLKALDDSEAMQYLKDGDIEKYNAKLTERVKAEADAERQSAEQKIAEREKRIAEQDARIHSLMVHGDIVKAFIANGGKAEEVAQDFATSIADKYWSVNENGEKEVRDPKTGQLLMGKAGMMTESEFCQQILRRDASLLFEPVQGSGASGGGSGSSTKRYSEMSAAERGAYAAEHGDEALAALP